MTARPADASTARVTGNLTGMKAVVIGCGRTGSSVATNLAAEGWDVTCVDEDETALGRLGDWRGGFVVGHGMDLEVLERAGIADADAAVVATDDPTRPHPTTITFTT